MINKTPSILGFWPFPDKPPRENQVKALKWLEQQSYKYLIIEAPVGSGKSLIAFTYARFLAGKSFILTTQKILQNQYAKEFSEQRLFSIYGKNNYECKRLGVSCNIGRIVGKCKKCEYTLALAAAKDSPHLVMNYTHAFLVFNYMADMFKTRKLIVFDEAHNIEEHLTSHKSVFISKKKCEKFGVQFARTNNIQIAFKWLTEQYYPKAKMYFEDIDSDVEHIKDRSSNSMSLSDIKLLKEWEILDAHLCTIREFVVDSKDHLDEKFVLIPTNESIDFKPLYGKDNFNRWLAPQAEKFLFMSSTILNPIEFCNDLGINLSDAAFLSLDSDFPKENRQTIYIPSAKMNSQWNSPENQPHLKTMLDNINIILDHHKDQKGIIHTGNFKIAEWLSTELLTVPGLNVYHHNPGCGDSRESVIDAFQTDPRMAVLISPSITEGLDLKDDLGRFAIFCKVPFPYLGDAWIKKRLSLSEEWYQRQALIAIVQGGGRIVRSKNDYGSTYILDQSWNFLYQKTKNTIPSWWKESYIEM